VVGARRDDTHRRCELVGRVPQRLVLARAGLKYKACAFEFDECKPDGMNVKSQRILFVGLLFFCAILAPSTQGQVPAPPQKPEKTEKTVTGRIEISGSKLYYEECGSGPSAVVLLHDGLLHSVTWDSVWKPLCAKYHTIRYDRRGFGRSEAPKAPFVPSEDLYALLERLRIERAVVVGNSSGSALAIDFALAHPDRVEGLFLIGPVVDGMEFSDAFKERGTKNNAPLTNGDTKAAAENWSQDRYIIGDGHDAARKRLNEELAASPQNFKGSGDFAIPNSRPSIERLNEIRVPTSILVGESDIADVHAQAGAIEEGIPGAERDIVINAGHLVQLEQPEILTDKLTNFVDRQERRAVTVPVNVLNGYVGSYKGAHGPITVALETDHLTLQVPGQAAFPLFAESPAKFFLRVSDSDVEFIRDPSGKASRAIFHINGETLRASRM
jgi:3-oxoadipate enol-lactonase